MKKSPAHPVRRRSRGFRSGWRSHRPSPLAGVRAGLRPRPRRAAVALPDQGGRDPVRLQRDGAMEAAFVNFLRKGTPSSSSTRQVRREMGQAREGVRRQGGHLKCEWGSAVDPARRAGDQGNPRRRPSSCRRTSPPPGSPTHRGAGESRLAGRPSSSSTPSARSRLRSAFDAWGIDVLVSAATRRSGFLPASPSWPRMPRWKLNETADLRAFISICGASGKASEEPDAWTPASPSSKAWTSR